MGSFSLDFFDGHHELLPSFDEAMKAVFDLSLGDVAALIGGVLWLVLLALSLIAIDRRDQTTGATYIFFMTAAGAVLTMALPARLQGSYVLGVRQATILMLMAATAAVRWKWWKRTPFRSMPIAARRPAPKAGETDE